MLDIDAKELEERINGKAEDAFVEKKPKFMPAPEVEPVAKELIYKFHPHLREANIQYMFRTGKWNKNERPVVGDVKLISPYYNVLTGYDFGIILNYEYWCSLTRPSQHQAILDHLLSFCYFTEDKDGNMKWKKIVPSIHEFPEVIARNGAYNEEVAELQNSLEEFETKE